MKDRDLNGRKQAGEAIDPDAVGVGTSSPASSPAVANPNRLTIRTVAEWGAADGADWLSVEPPKRVWLATDHGGKGVLSRAVVAILASAGGVGKTFALCELAILVAAGSTDTDHQRLWLDNLRVNGGRVLFIAGEESADELRRRLHAVTKRLLSAKQEFPHAVLNEVRRRLVVVPSAGMTDLPLLEADNGRNLRPSHRHAEIVAALKAGDEPFALVIVDPLARWAAGEIDKDNAAACAVISALEAFIPAGAREGKPGPCVLVAHHTSKAGRTGDIADGASKIRGASALTDNARWAALLEAGEADDEVSFEVVKSNYGGKPYFPLARGDDGVLRGATKPDFERWKAEAKKKAAEKAAEKAEAKAAEKAAAKAEDNHTKPKKPGP